jgi:hypothetical protein
MKVSSMLLLASLKPAGLSPGKSDLLKYIDQSETLRMRIREQAEFHFPIYNPATNNY